MMTKSLVGNNRACLFSIHALLMFLAGVTIPLWAPLAASNLGIAVGHKIGVIQAALLFGIAYSYPEADAKQYLHGRP